MRVLRYRLGSGVCITDRRQQEPRDSFLAVSFFSPFLLLQAIDASFSILNVPYSVVVRRCCRVELSSDDYVKELQQQATAMPVIRRPRWNERFNNCVWFQGEKKSEARSRLCTRLEQALGEDHFLGYSTCSSFLCCFSQNLCDGLRGSDDFFYFQVDTNTTFTNSMCEDCMNIFQHYPSMPRNGVCPATVFVSDCFDSISDECNGGSRSHYITVYRR